MSFNIAALGKSGDKGWAAVDPNQKKHRLRHAEMFPSDDQMQKVEVWVALRKCVALCKLV